MSWISWNNTKHQCLNNWYLNKMTILEWHNFFLGSIDFIDEHHIELSKYRHLISCETPWGFQDICMGLSDMAQGYGFPAWHWNNTWKPDTTSELTLDPCVQITVALLRCPLTIMGDKCLLLGHIWTSTHNCLILSWFFPWVLDSVAWS